MSEEKMTRAMKSKKTKEKIYETAISLFKDHGYEATTVSMICKHAQVAIGSFYHFYDSKESLIFGLFDQAGDYFERNHIKLSDDPDQAILEIYQGYNQFLIDQGIDIVSAFYGSNNKNLSINSILATTNKDRPINLMIEQQLRKGIENHVFSKDLNSFLASVDIATVALGVRMRWIFSDGSFDLNEMTSRILKMYLQGLKE